MDIESIDNEEQGVAIDARETYQRMSGISVENLSFTYDRDVVLKNASAFIEKGDFVAITGRSGVGKSTLIKLLLGIYSLR
jgi:ATP-binding cassette subfamily B protein